MGMRNNCETSQRVEHVRDVFARWINNSVSLPAHTAESIRPENKLKIFLNFLQKASQSTFTFSLREIFNISSFIYFYNFFTFCFARFSFLPSYACSYLFLDIHSQRYENISSLSIEFCSPHNMPKVKTVLTREKLNGN